MVLQAILDLPKGASDQVTDAQISQATQVSLDEVRNWLETLEGEGYANVVRTTAGLSASITAQGRLALEQFRGFPEKPWVAGSNVPPRNHLFTGRKGILKQIRSTLDAHGRAALCGLPGVGKTQTAIQYAHVQRSRYKAILWGNASSYETFITSYVALAPLLNLDVRGEADQTRITDAVMQRLDDCSGWLLILDNADEPGVVQDFLPTGASGHILLTTRNPASLPLAQPVPLEPMPSNAGARLLLRRAQLYEVKATRERDAQRRAARGISRRLGGLPLALDQAGAFILERQISPDEYLGYYADQGEKLRTDRGELGERDHPSVTKTFSLIFRTVEETNPAAADLLHLCAFLAPDAIPEEILVKGAPELGDRLGPAAAKKLTLANTLKAAYRTSILRRDPASKTLTIHRFVQEVLQDTIGEMEGRRWAENALRAINRTFPDHVDISTWDACARLLPHARACAERCRQWDAGKPEIGRLSHLMACYLKQRSQYEEAEKLLLRALEIRREMLGPEHRDTASTIRELAGLYHAYHVQCRDSEAESLHLQALEIREKILGPEHPETASSLKNLALLYIDLGRQSEAEPLLFRALAIREKDLGLEHPHTAGALNSIGNLRRYQGRYSEAEDFYRRALAIWEKVQGPNHRDTGRGLNNLGNLRRDQGNYAEAEPYYRRALDIWEATLGPNHLDTSRALSNLGSILVGRQVEAEPLLFRALKIREKVLGPEHPHTAGVLNSIGNLRRSQARYPEAEGYYRRALAIWEKVRGPDHRDTGRGLNNLGNLHRNQGRYSEAEPYYQRALEIWEKTLGADHLDTSRALSNLGSILHRLGRDDEAEPLLRRALAIRERVLGTDHPYVASVLEHLADLLSASAREDEAEALRDRAATIPRKLS
jgi:tetratricopeptide (TPR) repeat protein